MTPEEIFLNYVKAGLTRDAEAQAAMFAQDGVFEAPLLPADHPLPNRLAGRDAIRAGIGAYHRTQESTDMTVDYERSRYTLHQTTDPDVFIAEIDTAVRINGTDRMISLLHIYRVRDGQITLLRDYFTADQLG